MAPLLYNNKGVKVMNIIETKKLSKNYGKNIGIEDVDMKIGQGEIFGFIGPNGAGKSTLIRTLLNFLYPTSGEGTIFRKDIVKESKSIKEKVGYVPSEVKYYGKVSVKEMINYAKSFAKNPYKDEEIEVLIKDLNIDLSKNMDELSLGNKKKVAIVQALIGRPEILILDEPTSGLDPLIQKKLFKILRSIKDSGGTVFFSSHNLSEVESICDRVLIINQGRVVKLIDLKTTIKDLGRVIDIKGNFSNKFISTLAENIICCKDNLYSITYKGEIDEFIKQISKYDIDELSIRRETLEDTFIKYYESEEK